MNGKNGSRASEHDRVIWRLIQYRAETGCCFEAQDAFASLATVTWAFPWIELFNIEQTRMTS